MPLPCRPLSPLAIYPAPCTPFVCLCFVQMGIAWALKTLRALCPMAFHVQRGEVMAPRSDALLLDLHALLRTLLRNNFTETTPGETAAAAASRIMPIINAVMPCVVVAAVDGVAPLAKRPTQQARRKRLTLTREGVPEVSACCAVTVVCAPGAVLPPIPCCFVVCCRAQRFTVVWR